MRLYHNPRCSKSRQAVALLTERGIKFDDYRYLEHGIAEEDMAIIAPLEGVIRKRDIGDLGTLDLTKSADIKTLLKDNPKALERPILVNNGKAVIGRPPENILSIIQN